jgi:putative lipoprotein
MGVTMYFKRIITFLTMLVAVMALTACYYPRKRVPRSEASSVQKVKIPKKSESTKATSSSQQERSKSSQTSSSSAPASESKATSSPDEVTDGLPQDAQSANKDKIYATGNAKVYYRSFEGGFSAQTPDFKGYTEEQVKKVLGEPEAVIKDPNYIKNTFKAQELENIKELYRGQHVTEEQAKAFYVTAADIAQAASLNQDYQLESDYILYSYKQHKINLIFSKGELYYMTPNPDYLYFK